MFPQSKRSAAAPFAKALTCCRFLTLTAILPPAILLMYAEALTAARLSRRLRWMEIAFWHCHVSGHEDNEMMRPYSVTK
jgi:hypothetical protein